MRLAGWAALLLATAAPVAAQTVANGRTIYAAAFFARFAPASALDMVRRIPGFTLEQAEEEVRGFGVAAGNVVINGQRPSSKTDTLETILARIPATRVTRIEIAPGAVFGAEYTGKAQVANLVLEGDGGVAGTVTGAVRRSFDGRVVPQGSVSALVKRGASTFNAAVGIENEQTSEEGIDRVRALPSGTLTEFRRKVNTIANPAAYASASWDHNLGPFQKARLNGRWAIDRFRLDQTNRVEPVGGVPRDDRLRQRFSFDDYEIGGDVMRPLAGGGIKLIGLATRRERDNRERALLRVADATIGGFVQALRSTRDERVARLLWNRPDLAGWSVELGAEGAFNRLRSRNDLFGIDAAGALSRIDLPVDDATVQEYRGEAFLNAGRALDPKLRLDLGLAYERSRLTVSGDAAAERTLGFVKPRATLDWRPGDGWRVQGSLARTVAQLRFEDFVGAAELANERVNGGNPNIVPQRAWEALLTVERPILGDGLLKGELGYNRVAQVQDRVPTPEGFDAPGNLGDGSERIARLTWDVPVTRLGIRGGRISGRLSYVGTSVRDPYTGDDRRFSGNTALVWAANWRQDLGSVAWGFGLEGQSGFTNFRRDELDSLYPGKPYVTAFAEYRASPRTTVTLAVDNLADVTARRERLFFRPDRRTTAPFQIEERIRNQHVLPYLTVRHNFG